MKVNARPHVGQGCSTFAVGIVGGPVTTSGVGVAATAGTTKAWTSPDGDASLSTVTGAMAASAGRKGSTTFLATSGIMRGAAVNIMRGAGFGSVTGSACVGGVADSSAAGGNTI